ncbi:hypothetical protein SK3146_01986 [Paenibacillus konkukensis]|uniref:Uncharacterized protein n=1 Tax=Paenibacillus konkukensis TaxID=2020716 RepID=A0ABY4RLQ8_9BACL|nr:hypothetical protein [Paenibacillus konkukensis]UQZ82826.1 hypothetical protein SK3146_01986 [Paenibacillus konkukensis]
MTWTESVNRLWNALKEHQPSLYPMEEWDELLDIRISKMPCGELNADQLPYASAVKAGLHLLNESLDKSHTLSQSIDNATGSYWHGVMHRMEGDYSNAKYWFRMAGAHPAYGLLIGKLAQISYDPDRIGSAALRGRLDQLMTSPVWNPGLFTDAVEQQVTVYQDEAAEALLAELQWMEIKLLLQYSFQQTGGSSLEF